MTAPNESPAWYRCTKSSNPLFTAGVAYETHSHEGGSPIVCTNDGARMAKLPVDNASFEPYDPWHSYRSRGASGVR